jgi:hypothetical protein
MSTSVSFLYVYGIFKFFQLGIYGYTEEARCALHKGQLGGVVAEQWVSQHHRYSHWKQTEVWREFGDTGMKQTD